VVHFTAVSDIHAESEHTLVAPMDNCGMYGGKLKPRMVTDSSPASPAGTFEGLEALTTGGSKVNTGFEL
jgi:hypothetical protein